ncbi:MAG: hypothetical protein IPH05_08485 [Flavobacteriales bacterium]|nr:hypothetical protein [Flavobacteriales bacterium]
MLHAQYSTEAILLRHDAIQPDFGKGVTVVLAAPQQGLEQPANLARIDRRIGVQAFTESGLTCDLRRYTASGELRPFV